MSSDETRDTSLAFSTTGQFLWWYFYHGAVTFVVFIEYDVLKALTSILLCVQKSFDISRPWLTSGGGAISYLHQEVKWIELSTARGSWDKWAEGMGVEEGTLSLPLYRLSECFMFMYICLYTYVYHMSVMLQMCTCAYLCSQLCGWACECMDIQKSEVDAAMCFSWPQPTVFVEIRSSP